MVVDPGVGKALLSVNFQDRPSGECLNLVADAAGYALLEATNPGAKSTIIVRRR